MPFQFYCPQGHLLEGHESQMGQQSQCPMCGSVFVIPMMQGGPVPGGPFPGMPMSQPGGMPPGAVPGQPGGWPGYSQPATPGYGQPLPPAYPQMYPQGGYFPGYPGAPGPAFPGGPSMPPTSAPGYPPMSPEQQFTGGGFPGPGGGQPPGFMAEEQAPSFPTGQTEPQPAAPEAAAAPQAPAEQPPAPEPPKEPRIIRIPCPQGHELQTPTDMLDQEVLCPICGTQFHLRYEDSVEYKQEVVERRRQRAEQLNKTALKWAIIAAVVIVLGIVAMIIYLVARTEKEEYLPVAEPAVEAPADAESKPEEPVEKTAEPDGE